MFGLSSRWVRCLLFFWLIGLQVACGSEYPQDTHRGRISGKLFYSGSENQKLSTPAIGVFAQEELSFEGLAVSSQLFIKPEISTEGIEYGLENLRPSQYFVIAILFELGIQAAPQDAAEAMGISVVQVEAGKTIPDINIQLSDR